MNSNEGQEQQAMPSTEQGALSDKTEVAASEEDDELQELLKSALEDFGTPSTKTTVIQPSVQQTKSTTKKEKQKKQEKQGPSSSMPPFPEGFPPLDPEMMGQVDEAFKKMLGSDPLLKEHWDKLTESCNKAAQATTDEDFEASLNDTLKNLSENAQSLINNGGLSDDIHQDELTRMLQQLGVPEGETGEAAGVLPDIMPMITQMMQNLLSKEILYPALKDLTNKYPQWLEDNKDSLSKDELTRYGKQLDLMRNVCHEFEAESEGDSSEEKSARFQNILKTMQAMQECGSPPKDLIGDVPEGSEDLSKILGSIPGGANSQCCIQ
jgi:peroxin-19